MKKYTLSFKHTSQGTLVTSENEGYTSLELLGLLSLKKEDIIAQLNGDVDPKFVRKVIVDE